MTPFQLITILGPTASGKTTLAAHLAHLLHTEVISADSRQVYKGMDIGTGKDLEDYRVQGENIPYHLIDIVPAGYNYNVFEFQRDFLSAYQEITQRGETPILCGGSGMYLEAVLRGYRMIPVPENTTLRKALAEKTLPELTEMLKAYKTLHNTTDVDTTKRAIRAIEIEEYYRHTPLSERAFPIIKSLNIGLDISRELRRERITARLTHRLENGLVAEVKHLLEQGLTPQQLLYYGLEYKFVTLHLMGELTYNDMVKQWETAIHQFAKRQMTYFRGMQRRGITIHWVDGTLSTTEKLKQITQLLWH